MKKIQLWNIRCDDSGKLSAFEIPTVKKAETEDQLEDLLVRSPYLLMEGLTLIGRQVPTEGGPLDLLGVDQDGHLVIFELKREALTRDAVAQVLDYASDIKRMDVERFARLVEDSSGQRGIDKIEDFADWYFQTFQDRENVFDDSPRMVLVGLGVDTRALRMVDFLAESGIDISILTFHAYEQDNSLFLARQVESVSPKPNKAQKYKSYSKEANLQALRASATELGISDFIDEVVEFVDQRVSTYKWPNRAGYAFSWDQRVHVNVSLNWEQKNSLYLYFYEIAVQSIGNEISSLTDILQNSVSKHKTLTLILPKDKWVDVKAPLERVLDKLAQARQKSVSD